jgi:transcriptional regulator with XRE-family HTH domain
VNPILALSRATSSDIVDAHVLGAPIQSPSVFDLIRCERMAYSLLSTARARAGLSIAELARRAGTSRPTVSAYEHGRVSPTVDTLERLLAVTGNHLTVTPTTRWTQVSVGRGRIAHTPDRLPDLAASQALRTFHLPIHLDWSSPSREVRLSDRRQRLQAYEVVLREGRPVDIESIVDGSLLVDGWEDMFLPVAVRSAWQPLIDRITHVG